MVGNVRLYDIVDYFNWICGFCVFCVEGIVVICFICFFIKYNIFKNRFEVDCVKNLWFFFFV